MFAPIFLGRPHSLSKMDKMARESLLTREHAGPYDYGMTMLHAAVDFSMQRTRQ